MIIDDIDILYQFSSLKKAMLKIPELWKMSYDHFFLPNNFDKFWFYGYGFGNIAIA